MLNPFFDSYTIGIMLFQVFALLFIFQLKHYLADYIFQTEEMLGKFKAGWDFVFPLSLHCAVHSFFTFCILVGIQRLDLWWLIIVDFVSHFVIDRIKASPNLLGRYRALSANEIEHIKGVCHAPTLLPVFFEKELRSNRFFWWTLGMDQMLHHLVHYFIIFKIIT